MARRQTNDDSEQRTAFLGVQLTPSEKAELVSRANSTGRHLSEFVRLVLLSDAAKPAPSARDPQAIRALAVEISRVGNNLNQLARLANERRAPAEAKALQDVTDQLTATLEKEKKHPLAYALDKEASAANENKQRGVYKTLADGEASRVQILGGQNFGFEIDSAERLELARRVMEWNGKAENQASKTRKCEQDCFHASLSWEQGQEPTADDMRQAAHGFMKALGMEAAQAVFIAHTDTEHPHMHIVASRIDPATGKTFSPVDDYTKAQAWALTYEREQGLTSANENRRQLQSLAAAVAVKDHDAVLEHLTARTPTFTPRELDKALSLGNLPKEER
eukprot:gene17873-18103_t